MTLPHRRTVSILLAAIAILLGADLDAAPDPRAALRDLRVLIVTPQAADGHGTWIETLLEAHGARADRSSWKGLDEERARAFDLIVVTGPRRQATERVSLDLGRPVLGIGSYAYSAFGQRRLKHGRPFS